MNVGSLCARPPVTVSTDASLAEAARLMCERHVGSIVVMGEGAGRAQVAGIITDRDIVRAQVHRTSDLSTLSAADIMTADPLAISEHDSIGAAVSHMRARGVRRAPVVSQDGTLVGVVSADDLLARLAAQVAGMAGIVAQQVRAEIG